MSVSSGKITSRLTDSISKNKKISDIIKVTAADKNGCGDLMFFSELQILPIFRFKESYSVRAVFHNFCSVYFIVIAPLEVTVIFAFSLATNTPSSLLIRITGDSAKSPAFAPRMM